jgi:flavodoxin
MNSGNKIFKGVGIGLAVVGSFVLISFIYKKIKNLNSNLGNTDQNNLAIKSIIIGDSQTPYIAKQSQKIKMLGSLGGENVLWKGGIGLKWLKDAVTKYPVSNDVKNVVINIGTNGGFNIKDDVLGLINELKRVFPKSKFYAVKGSWGWGGNKNKTQSQVDAYYDKFKNNSVIVLQTAIGSVTDPHGNLPVYKEIGKEIDKTIE